MYSFFTKISHFHIPFLLKTKENSYSTIFGSIHPTYYLSPSHTSILTFKFLLNNRMLLAHKKVFWTFGLGFDLIKYIVDHHFNRDLFTYPLCWSTLRSVIFQFWYELKHYIFLQESRRKSRESFEKKWHGWFTRHPEDYFLKLPMYDKKKTWQRTVVLWLINGTLVCSKQKQPNLRVFYYIFLNNILQKKQTRDQDAQCFLVL